MRLLQVLSIAFLCGFVASRIEFYTDTKRAVEKEFSDDGQETCYIHGDRSYIMEVMLNKQIDVNVVDSARMESILTACDVANLNTTHLEYGRTILRKKRFIMYPGTKWCGAGSTEANFDDLGVNAETDKCCREHDQCEISIPPVSRKYGLYNPGFTYISHCSCDDQFNSCLKNAGETAAERVGFLFFKLFRFSCIEEIGGTVKQCVKRGGWWSKCKEYKTVARMKWRNAKSFQVEEDVVSI